MGYVIGYSAPKSFRIIRNLRLARSFAVGCRITVMPLPVFVHPHSGRLDCENVRALYCRSCKVALYVGCVIRGKSGHFVAQKRNIYIRTAFAAAVKPYYKRVFTAVGLCFRRRPACAGKSYILSFTLIVVTVLIPRRRLGDESVACRYGVLEFIAVKVFLSTRLKAFSAVYFNRYG